MGCRPATLVLSSTACVASSLATRSCTATSFAPANAIGSVVAPLGGDDLRGFVSSVEGSAAGRRACLQRDGARIGAPRHRCLRCVGLLDPLGPALRLKQPMAHSSLAHTLRALNGKSAERVKHECEMRGERRTAQTRANRPFRVGTVRAPYCELFASVAKQAREFGHPLLERANRPLPALCETAPFQHPASTAHTCAPRRTRVRRADADGCGGKLSPHRARRAAPRLQEAG